MTGHNLSPSDRLTFEQLAKTMELNLSRGGIYIVVSEERKSETVFEKLNELFAVHELDLSSSQDAIAIILSDLQDIKKTDADRTVFSIKTYNLPDDKLKSLLNALNIRREYIPDAKINLVLRVDNERLSEVPKHAKDFWSFRTVVSRFESYHELPAGESDTVKQIIAELANTEAMIKDAQDKKASESILAALYFRLAELCYKMSELEKALSAFKNAGDLYEKIKDSQGEASALDNIGLIYQDKGDYEQALKYFERAEEIFTALNLSHKVQIFHDLIGEIKTEQIKRPTLVSKQQEDYKP